jgi:Xaa-Pro aminopeptidase
VEGARIRITRGDALGALSAAIPPGKGLRLGYEKNRVSVASLERLRSAVGDARRVRWKGVEGIVEGFRAVKDAAELDALRASAKLGSRLFEEVLPLVRPGIRELELAAAMEYRMKLAGAEGPAFETIVAFGERSALPHARPTERRLGKNELVLLDWGAILRGYCSDLSRTVFVGRAPAEVRRRYRAVLEAQQAALGCIRPGSTGQQVDAQARGLLRGARLARYFTHSTGHGLGLEIHEEPRLARGQNQQLVAGNVVTVEPGIYLEGVGGIRIEDDVLVTTRGPEVLTSAPREFLQI